MPDSSTINIAPVVSSNPKEAQANSGFAGAHWLQFSGSHSTQGNWFIARREFNLENSPQGMRAFVAADSKYWLYVNGALVVAEGASPGLRRRYEEVKM